MLRARTNPLAHQERRNPRKTDLHCRYLRTAEHLSQWNETSLDAMFGLLTVPELSYVCLFINKYDLISDNSADAKPNIQLNYKRVLDYLQFKVKGKDVEVEVMVGSAESGESLNKVLSKLMRHSVPARPA